MQIQADVVGHRDKLVNNPGGRAMMVDVELEVEAQKNAESNPG